MKGIDRRLLSALGAAAVMSAAPVMACDDPPCSPPPSPQLHPSAQVSVEPVASIVSLVKIKE
jgi:hypothetical protein